MSDPAPRLRFAPSPTGFFHVGGARTVLYNWLHARQHHGTFVLRIEDTDTERNRPEWTEGILSALHWIGVDWDEGPFFQSERVAEHVAAAQRLVAAGLAYYCDMTPEQVQERAKAEGRQGYGGWSRERGLGPGPGRVLRFRTPDEGTTVVHDVIRGDVSFENALLEDFVVLRSNGTPMFLLANVVDDIAMRITHVVRGEEHLPNTPKAILLWRALTDVPEPVWAHVPVLVNDKRQKLSKRRDKVALEMYRDEGYLPEAMVNYLMTLGWAPPGPSEIVPFATIRETFRLADVNSSPAFFDEKKLRAFNGEYLRALPLDEFVERCRPFLPLAEWPRWDDAAFRTMAPLLQTRLEVLSQVPALVDFLFTEEPPDDPASWTKAVQGTPAAAPLLDDTIDAYARSPWEAEALKGALTEVGERHGLKLGKAQAPVRVAVTGRTVGPPLFEALEVLGRDRTLERLRAARRRIG